MIGAVLKSLCAPSRAIKDGPLSRCLASSSASRSDRDGRLGTGSTVQVLDQIETWART